MTFLACRSSWIFASFLLAFEPWAASLAQEPTLRVRPADREQISTEPRQVVATSFTVTNVSRAPVEVVSQLVLPARWQPVTPAVPFMLAPGESALKLVSFTIPEEAQGGDYAVRYEVRDLKHPANTDSYSLQVRVMPSTRLQLTMLDLPDQALAGGVVDGAVLLRNSGNVRVSGHFEVKGRFVSSINPQRGEFVLEPAESRRIALAIAVGGVSQRSMARLTVTATSADAAFDATTSGAFPVLPRAGALDAFRTLDARIESRFVARDTPAGRTSGFQPAVYGGGSLGEHDGLLQFHFRGPDLRQSGSFGSAEEYWLRYENQRFAAGAGDLGYGLTPLTEPGRLGRGAFIGYKDDRWGATAYGMRDEFGDGNTQQIGAASHVAIGSDAWLGLNYLRRTDADGAADIWSLRAQSAQAAGFNMDLELARSLEAGARGGALRFALRDDRHALRYYALGWSADPGFSGPLRDKLYLSAGFDYPRAGGFGLRGYFRMQDWNLTPIEDIEPDLRQRLPLSDRMSSGPADQQVSLGATRAIGRSASATVDVVFRERTGSTNALQSVDRESWSWRAGINRSWRNLSLLYSMEQGKARDANAAMNFATSSQVLSGSFRVGGSQSYSVYFTRDDESDLDERNQRRDSSGFTASYTVGGGLSLNLNWQYSRSRSGRGSLFDLAISHQAERGGRLTFCARRLEGRFARNDFLLSYSMPFDLPVMRRNDVATLRGRVFDAETSRGLKDVVLKLDGAAAITNARGEFRFPAVGEGAHRIALEHGSLDVKQVPATGAALSVTVAGRDAAPVMIPMVRSVTIGVQVTLHPGNLEPARAATGVLVTFRNGDTLYRRLTDASGRVRLGGITPGNWLVSVAQDTVAPGYQPADGELRLVLAPGDTVTAEFPLSPVRREMRMLAPLAVR